MGTVGDILSWIKRKKRLDANIDLFEIEASYVGRSTRLLDPALMCQQIRAKWGN
jgi:hypothetical protein